MPSRPDVSPRLAVGDVAIDLDLTAGARAVSWTVGGVEILARHGSDPVNHGMYPMAPWAGRIRDNAFTWAGTEHHLPVTYDPWALHGTALRQSAVLTEHESSAERVRIVARIDSHPGWPWPAAVDIEWDLRPRVLTTAITVHALADSFPVVTGWHPWFRRSLGGAPAQWAMQASAMLERGEDHLPTGRRVPFDPDAGPFDDAFAVPDGRAAVTWPGQLSLDIASDHGWFVVFDELPASLCVEPQSGPPDGLRASAGWQPELAEPGRPHVLRTTWAMHDLAG